MTLAIRRVSCFGYLRPDPSGYLAVGVGTGIAAGGGLGQPCEVVDPAPLMVGAGCRVRQAAMGHAQQRSIRLVIDQVDLDQARARRHIFVMLVPPETVGEPVGRNALGEPTPAHLLSGDA